MTAQLAVVFVYVIGGSVVLFGENRVLKLAMVNCKIVRAQRVQIGNQRPISESLLDLKFMHCTYFSVLWDYFDIVILYSILGYRSPIIICDDCMFELTGFSFQCLESSCSRDLSQVFDLCHKHYNEDYHSIDGHKKR